MIESLQMTIYKLAAFNIAIVNSLPFNHQVIPDNSLVTWLCDN